MSLDPPCPHTVERLDRDPLDLAAELPLSAAVAADRCSGPLRAGSRDSRSVGQGRSTLPGTILSCSCSMLDQQLRQ